MAFDTARRVQEIGIRKVLGASTRDILRLLLRQLLRPVVVANLVAWPIAWGAMSRWLGGFDDRITLSPLFFLASSALVLLIAATTVVGQTLRVARAEPSYALRRCGLQGTSVLDGPTLRGWARSRFPAAQRAIASGNERLQESVILVAVATNMINRAIA